MVGRFALGLAVTAPVLQFSGLQLRIIMASDAAEEHDFEEYLSVRLTTTFLAFLVIVIVVALTGYEEKTSQVVLAIGLAKCFESLSDGYHGLFQQLERIDLLSRSFMIRGLSTLLVVGSTLYATRALLPAVVAMAALWFVVLIAHDRATARVLTPARPGFLRRMPSNLAAVRPLLIPALALGLTGVIMSIYFSIPKYLIQHFEGEGSLGVFAAAASFVFGGFLVLTALGQAAVPRLAQLYAKNLAGFKLLVVKLTALGFLIGVLGATVAFFFGADLLELVYGPEYRDGSKALFFLALGATMWFPAWCLNYAANAARYFKIQAFIAALLSVAVFLGCWFWIPSWSLVGASLATVLSAAVQLVCFATLLWLIVRRWPTTTIAAEEETAGGPCPEV